MTWRELLTISLVMTQAQLDMEIAIYDEERDEAYDCSKFVIGAGEGGREIPCGVEEGESYLTIES